MAGMSLGYAGIRWDTLGYVGMSLGSPGMQVPGALLARAQRRRDVARPLVGGDKREAGRHEEERDGRRALQPPRWREREWPCGCAVLQQVACRHQQSAHAAHALHRRQKCRRHERAARGRHERGRRVRRHRLHVKSSACGRVDSSLLVNAWLACSWRLRATCVRHAPGRCPRNSAVLGRELSWRRAFRALRESAGSLCP
jgi:hypothetical protein